MNMKKFLMMLLSGITLSLAAQDITLEECLALARENYPLVRKYGLIEKTSGIDLSDIDKTWLPQISLYAQGTVQNKVPGFPDGMNSMLDGLGLDMPGLRKDQYKTGLDLNQIVWDGGKSVADRDVARATAHVQTTANEVEMYAMEERVQDLYFGILLIEAQIGQNELTANLLLSNLDRLRSMFANGTATRSDVESVEAEFLTVLQNMTRMRGTEDAYRRMLGLFAGKSLDGCALTCPDAGVPLDMDPDRPELRHFDAEWKKIESQRKLINVSVMPKIGFFAQTYYGYPGFDYFHSMMSRDWSFNIMAGIKISWSIDSYYTKKNRINRLNVAGNDLEVARDLFLFNNKMISVQQQSQIRHLRSIISDDVRIVELRSSVRKAAESRLKNGVIDTTELLSRITDESESALNATYHKIELIKTIYKLKYTLNR